MSATSMTYMYIYGCIDSATSESPSLLPNAYQAGLFYMYMEKCLLKHHALLQPD